MNNIISVPFIESLVYMLSVYGIYILFRILKYPDISADNVFAFGSITGAFFLIAVKNIFIALMLTAIAGYAIGCFTSLLFSHLKVPKLLSGIITYSILFSINLKFFQKPNISFSEGLYDSSTIPYLIFCLDVVAVLGIIALFKTRLGKTLIAAGSNPSLLVEFQAPYKLVLMIGLGLSSSFIALSGFLNSMYFGFADVNIGIGILINSVAAIILSEKLMIYFNKKFPFRGYPCRDNDLQSPSIFDNILPFVWHLRLF